MKQKRYPEGHFMGLGIAIGIPLGIPIGLALGNIALGPAIGAAIGVLIGILMEKKKNPNPRELTKEEKRIKSRNLKILLYFGIVLFSILLLLFFISR